MKTLSFFLMVVMMSVQSFSQVAPQKYFIEFMDRYNSPYSVNTPQQYLSNRAIERRQRQGIPIVENDLPVNPNYINIIRSYPVTILNRSKWLNGITVYSLNPSLIDSIRELPFVKRVIKNVNQDLINIYNPVDKYILYKHSLDNTFAVTEIPWSFKRAYTESWYGASYAQVHMVGADSMHAMGYRGEGIVIAVLDAGFKNTDLVKAFDSLWFNNQILGTRDFVKPGNNVFQEDDHGTAVLSVMGANIPGQLVGTAPKAAYWLLRTEDVSSEYLIEEYNWISAAEFADSAGADIINSSLGYTRFNDPAQDHTCHDMNGNTTPVTIGANIAAGKGMVVVNSAGNKGSSSTWQCMSAPADGFGVLAVAAVDSNGIWASFSSVGEAGSRVKPNVAAMGSLTAVSSSTGPVIRSSGTSFSTPVISGATACLLQAAKNWSSGLIIRSIELSSNKINSPDKYLGYGVPNFISALQHLSVPAPEPQRKSLIISPNPTTGGVVITVTRPVAGKAEISIYNLTGNAVKTFVLMAGAGELLIRAGFDISDLPDGVYLVCLQDTDGVNCELMLKIAQ